jgi:GTP cyclohydrolase IA
MKIRTSREAQTGRKHRSAVSDHDLSSSVSSASSAVKNASSGVKNESSALAESSFEDLVREMLIRIGENPGREGLLRTPGRVQRAFEFLTKGCQGDPQAIVRGALFSVTYDEMVIVKDIEMFSLCEHHLLPFFGKVHVAYIPKGKVIGLSKIPRLVDCFARRLQVQERMTTQIADAIESAIRPLGVGVVVEARHLCMMMRGVEKQHSAAVTSAMRGAFRSSKRTRDEFLSLIHGRTNGNSM